jgi:hypothetical protein
MAHSFGKFCIDKQALVEKETLDGFLKALLKQSNQDDALIPYHDQIPEEDNGKLIRAPRYYGAGTELLSECYFEEYGRDYNLTGIKSYNDEEVVRKDGGVDQEARSIKSKHYSNRLNTLAKPNSPIYIQCKGSLNPTKEFTTNDGSRVMNFYGHAQGLARAEGQSYNARYILFTTGYKLHWVLEQNTFNMIEVVNYNNIKKRVNGDRIFWNRLREKFGLSTLDLSKGPVDPEYKSILTQFSEQ